MNTALMPCKTSTLLSIVYLLLFMLAGCTPSGVTRNIEEDHFQTAELEERLERKRQENLITAQIMQQSANLPRWSQLRPPLSPGDRLQVNIQNGETFSGVYEIDIDGAVNIPYLPSLHVAGYDVKEVERMIRTALVDAKQFHASRVWVSVLVQQWAAVQVHVSGAVFNSGIVTINVRDAEERTQKSTQYSGDFPLERLLPAALRSAGGVRPDAAIDKISLIRNGKPRLIDYTGIIDGVPIDPIPLMTGDTIIVPSSGTFDNDLIVPSVITTPGIRVFLSNLTVPARGNAISAIGKDATNLPYGSRFLAALTSSNCIGGTDSTNASRHALLVRSNPLTGKQEVVDRSINELFRNPDQSHINVFLMPNDSIGCYDSGVTNIRDIADTIVDILVPFTLF
jgi:polysaccharide export outer membrane protein